MVIVYSRTVCPKCLLVKSELKTAGIPFTEINMDKNEKAKELILSKGIMAAPVVDFNGDFEPDVTKILERIAESVETGTLQLV